MDTPTTTDTIATPSGQLHTDEEVHHKEDQKSSTNGEDVKDVLYKMSLRRQRQPGRIKQWKVISRSFIYWHLFL